MNELQEKDLFSFVLTFCPFFFFCAASVTDCDAPISSRYLDFYVWPVWTPAEKKPLREADSPISDKSNHWTEPSYQVGRWAGRCISVSSLPQRPAWPSPASRPLILHQVPPPAPQQTSYQMWLIAVIWTGAIKQITWIISRISLINTWLASN